MLKILKPQPGETRNLLERLGKRKLTTGKKIVHPPRHGRGLKKEKGDRKPKGLYGGERRGWLPGRNIYPRLGRINLEGRGWGAIIINIHQNRE